MEGDVCDVRRVGKRIEYRRGIFCEKFWSEKMNWCVEREERRYLALMLTGWMTADGLPGAV
jgi:hypothetical protein